MARARRKKVRVHAHGCVGCGVRYEDGCFQRVLGKRGADVDTPGPDGLCLTCRTGRQQAFWPEARLPRACCHANARLARKDECETYHLAGSGPWFVCPLCSRTFPFRNPKESPCPSPPSPIRPTKPMRPNST